MGGKLLRRMKYGWFIHKTYGDIWGFWPKLCTYSHRHTGITPQIVWHFHSFWSLWFSSVSATQRSSYFQMLFAIASFSHSLYNVLPLLVSFHQKKSIKFSSFLHSKAIKSTFQSGMILDYRGMYWFNLHFVFNKENTKWHKFTVLRQRKTWHKKYEWEFGGSNGWTVKYGIYVQVTHFTREKSSWRGCVNKTLDKINRFTSNLSLMLNTYSVQFLKASVTITRLK